MRDVMEHEHKFYYRDIIIRRVQSLKKSAHVSVMRLRRIVSSPWLIPIRGLLRPIEVAIAIIWMKRTLRKHK